MRSALTIALLASGFWWWRADPDVEKGNAKVAEGRPEEALADFDRAAPALTDAEQQRRLDFNRGLALHGAGRHDEAKKAFAHAAQSEDPVLRSRAAFNEGNVALQQNDRESAIKSFIQSLRADPEFAPAKRNLQFLLDQPPPPPDGGGGGGDGGGGDGGSDGGGGGGGDGGADGGGGGDGGPPSDGGQGKGDGGGKDDNKPPSMEDQQPQRVSEQDAMKLLDALRDAEKNRPLGKMMLKDQQPPRSAKEW